MDRISFGPGWLRKPGPDPQQRTLSRDEVRELISLVLRLGVMMLENGADSALTERALKHMARCMGCDDIEVLITATGIVITTEEDGDFRTKARRAPNAGVHMGKVAAISELAERMSAEPPSLTELGAEIDRIDEIHHYSGWLVVPAVAVSCGAFSQLFGGGAIELGSAFAVALVVVWVRRALLQRHFDAVLTTVVCAALGSVLAGKLCVWIGASSTPVVSAACVPMIPGVHFINSARDIFRGHVVNGMARGLKAALLVFAIALGVSIAMSVLPRLP